MRGRSLRKWTASPSCWWEASAHKAAVCALIAQQICFSTRQVISPQSSLSWLQSVWRCWRGNWHSHVAGSPLRCLRTGPLNHSPISLHCSLSLTKENEGPWGIPLALPKDLTCYCGRGLEWRSLGSKVCASSRHTDVSKWFSDQTSFSVDTSWKLKVEKWSKMLIENRFVWKIMGVWMGIKILLLAQMC